MFNGPVDPDMYQGPGMDLSFMDKFGPRQHNSGKSIPDFKFDGGNVIPGGQSRFDMLGGLMRGGLGGLFGDSGGGLQLPPKGSQAPMQKPSFPKPELGPPSPVQPQPQPGWQNGPVDPGFGGGRGQMPQFNPAQRPQQMPMQGFPRPEMRPMPMPPSRPSQFPQQMPMQGPPPPPGQGARPMPIPGVPSGPPPQLGPPDQAPMQMPQMGMPDLSWMDRFMPQQQPQIPSWLFDLFQPQTPQMPQWGQMFNWF